jgi:Protein of unknown function (DUF2752)
MAVDEIGKQRLKAVTLWVLLASGAAYLFVFEPGRTGIFLSCPFHTLTGLNCPGCGTTRGLHQLLHGHFIAAFELNPLMLLGLPILSYALIVYTRAAITGQPMPQFTLSPKCGWLLTGLVLGFWIFRNTLFYPFAT